MAAQLAPLNLPSPAFTGRLPLKQLLAQGRGLEKIALGTNDEQSLGRARFDQPHGSDPKRGGCTLMVAAPLMDLLISYSWGRFYPTRNEVMGFCSGWAMSTPRCAGAAWMGSP